jgi:hypothetical protein
VVGYGPFSLYVIHKEDLCFSSGDIDRLCSVYDQLKKVDENKDRSEWNRAMPIPMENGRDVYISQNYNSDVIKNKRTKELNSWPMLFRSLFLYIIINLLMSPLLGHRLSYGLPTRRTGHNPPRGPSADCWLLTTANAAGTNGLTCLPKHGAARDNKFLVTHPKTGHWDRCLASAIARRAHWPLDHRAPHRPSFLYILILNKFYLWYGAIYTTCLALIGLLGRNLPMS